MTFCLALGTDGVSLVAEAQANTLANAQVTPWVRDRARRHHHHPHRRRRDGPGLDDRPAADRRGGDGRRLVEGEDRMVRRPSPQVYGYKDPFSPRS